MIDLHVHTKYSLLDSISEPKQLIKKTKELNRHAICITEHGNLYSSIEIYKLCKENNVKYLHGCEMYICDNVLEKNKDNRYYHLILISKNEQGRQNLIKLVSLSNNYKYYGKPRIDFEILKQYKEGLIVLSACMAGEIQRLLLNNDYKSAKIIAQNYKKEFKEDYYLEYQSHTDLTQQKLNRLIVDLANELNIKYVVTTDSHFINNEDQKYHNIFVQIGQSREAGEIYNDCYIQTDEEVLKKCKSTTENENLNAMNNTYEIMDKCNVEIPLSAPIMPHVDIPEQFNSEIDYLTYLCVQGWKNRKINLLSQELKYKYKERLKYELKVIKKMGFEGYFLLVYSYANSVKRRGIARGSGGGSLVAYLTNIVDIDPVKYGLYFERFIDVGALRLLEEGKISKEQLKIPDFDLDFGKEDRNKVMQFITDKYGKQNVASLGSFQYIWAKGAIKDIGKVLGIPFETTNEITKKLNNETIDEALDLGLLDEYKEQYPKLFEYTVKLAGLPKSFSMHPCFTGDMLVATGDGYKKIKDVNVGDLVLTHKSNYKLVVNKTKNKSEELVSINACGVFPIECTPNHPFYIRNRMDKRKKVYSEPLWVKAKDIKKTDMIGLPINTESEMPTYKDLDFNNLNLWWIIGRYFGDGWCQYVENRNDKRLIICCSKTNKKELNEIILKINTLFDYRITEDKTVYKIYIKNNQLFEYLQRFGKYAHKKHLTNDILNLPIIQLRSFIDGYLSADGYYDNNVYSFKTVSYELATGLIQCVAKAYNIHCNVHIIKEKNEIIEGRNVKSKQKYMIHFYKEHRKKERNFYMNGYIWLFVKNVNIRKIKKDVYNLSVLDDNTYTINNIAVHNCGKVITMNSVDYYNAIEISDDGGYILQGDMHTAEDLGLIKIDILGLRTVDIIYDTLEMIGKDYNYIAPHNLNFNDKKVLENFKNGYTTGIFQFESDGMKGTLSEIECNSLYDLSVANALYRPGSIEFISNYARRRKGEEKYEFLHEDLISILKDSYAIIIFQEQLIEIGRIAGLSNPDELRVATGKKKPELMAKIKPELFEGLKKRGWNNEKLEELWDIMLRFAKYSFNKSHSYAYAIIAYICMFLKTYHSKEFIVAWINSYKGKTEKLPICIREAHRLNVDVLIPNWHEATDIAVIKNDNVYLGTQNIKFLNSQIAQELYHLSQQNTYTNFIDLIKDIKEKTSTNTRQLKILTGLNFFSQFGRNKKLLDILEIYESIGNSKQIKKDKAETLGLNIDILIKYTNKQTEKLYKDIDIISYIKEVSELIEDKPLSVRAQVKFEIEFLEYTTVKYPKADKSLYIITEYKTYKDRSKPYLTLRNLKTGEDLKTKVKNGKVFSENPFKLFDVLQVLKFKTQKKMKNVGGKWERSNEDEQILDEWNVY